MLHWNIYICIDTLAHIHTNSHSSKEQKSLKFMVSFVYRGMNVILSTSPHFGTQYVVFAIQNILLEKYTFQKYIILTKTATIKESTQPHCQPKQKLCWNVPRNRYGINTSKLAYLTLGDNINWGKNRKKKTERKIRTRLFRFCFFIVWCIYIYNFITIT